MARRSYGTGSLFSRRDAGGRESWYGKWYVGARRVKRKIGPKRQAGGRDGLTRAQAEAELRRKIEAADVPATPIAKASVGEAGERLVATLEARGRKASTLAAHESALHAHLVPFFGDGPLGRSKHPTLKRSSRRGEAHWHRSRFATIWAPSTRCSSSRGYGPTR